MTPSIAFAHGLSGHPTLPELPYAWLEAPLDARLAFLRDVPDWRDLGRWPAGRVFGEAGEYRWRTETGGTVHAVLLLDSGDLPVDFEAPLKLAAEGDAPLVLWGAWVWPGEDKEGNPDGGPRFFANEIPGIQTYPLELDGSPAETDTARLIIRTYRDSSGRHGEFTRCLKLELRAPELKDD